MKRCKITFKSARCRQLIDKLNMLLLLGTSMLMSLIIGCATGQVSTAFDPRSINEVGFRDRSQSELDDEVRVTVAVPTADENKALFSADLYLREIQPVWVKVENHSDRTYYLLSIPFDPNYFSPLETAYAVHGGLDQSARREMEKYYRMMNFRSPILPNTARSLWIRSTKWVRKHPGSCPWMPKATTERISNGTVMRFQ
ncbi:MAG: hypothetical protein V2I56_05520 [Desulfobacteraceae bacterium]|jgi:hypothetical protein|nr:hypothetical protein [Desulfobacteraceae bacterium]